MKKILILFISVALVHGVRAQQAVQWTFSAKKVAAQTYEIHLKAKIGEGWHLYSQGTPPGGPEPTVIKFGKNPLIILDGKVKENGDLNVYESPVFGVDVHSFEGSVDFVQVVKLKQPSKVTLEGTVRFMACTDQTCLTPATLPFKLKLE